MGPGEMQLPWNSQGQSASASPPADEQFLAWHLGEYSREQVLTTTEPKCFSPEYLSSLIICIYSMLRYCMLFFHAVLMSSKKKAILAILHAFTVAIF